ncbi:MAG: STAS domain-containing protein [Candidatus Aminicenantaceae bacterium]
MLRITSKKTSRKKTVIFLEGKICQEWVGELRSEIETGIKDGRKISLDFSRVSYIDEDGAKMIKRFPLQKVEKTNCSLFIRTILGIKK